MTEPPASSPSGASDGASSPRPSGDGSTDPTVSLGGPTPSGTDPTVRMDPVSPSDAGSGPSVLRGVVVAGTGDPVAGAEVEVIGPGGEIVGRATTVADGRFSVAQLPAGSYRLTVTKGGLLAAHLAHDHPGGRVHVELRPARITGTVTPADAAPGDHVDAEVAARDAEGHVSARTTTDPHGRFALDGLNGGRHEVSARAAGYFTARRQVDLDSQVEPLELELVPAELLGQVAAEESGEPILDAQAKLRSTDGTLVGQSVTDPAGRFLIPLASLAAAQSTAGATHRLEVTADGFEPATIDLTLTDEPVEELSVTMEDAKRSPWLWVGLGVALLALLALLFALFAGEDATVPDLTGATIEEAADLLEAEELVLGEVTFTEAEAEAEPGTVLSSDPEAGATATVGDAVDLTAAPMEDPTVEVPRVTGRQESDAVRLLDALGFEVVISRVASEEAAGIVVSQNPAPRTEVPAGDQVGIDISQGPDEEDPASEQEPEQQEPEQEAPEQEAPEQEASEQEEPEQEEPEQEEPAQDPEPLPGTEGGNGDGAELPDLELPDVEFPDVELPEVDTEELRGFFERIVEWFRSAFSG